MEELCGILYQTFLVSEKEAGHASTRDGEQESSQLR